MSSRRKMEGRDVLADVVVLVKTMLMHAIGTYMRSSCAENKYGSGLSGVTLSEVGTEVVDVGWLVGSRMGAMEMRLHRRCNLAARASVVVHVPY